MKMLINALSARTGGGQTYLINLIEHMPRDLQIEVLVYAPRWLPLPSHPKVRRMQTTWPTDNPILRAVWERFVLPRVLRREAVDVLFCPGGLLNSRVPAGCKTVTMFRNMLPFDARERRRLPYGLQRVRNAILERLMLRSLASADLAIFISSFARSVIERKTKLRRAVTIPHGVAPRFRSFGEDLPRPRQLPPGEYFLYVSRFDHYKQHREVVQAYFMLPASIKQQYALVLIGERDNVLAREVDRLIADAQAQDRVFVLGLVPYDELPAYYHHTACTLFASSCENCPNILLEALGAGRPVACSDVAPMPEFGGNAVLYFSPFSPESIAKAIVDVVSDATRAKALGQAAAERSRAFDWHETIRRTFHEITSLSDVTPQTAGVRSSETMIEE